MDKEITDGEKHDLALVVCDKFTCLGRSEFPRCYEDSFKDCPYYLLGDHHYSDADIKVYREIKSINRRLNGNKNNRREWYFKS